MNWMVIRNTLIKHVIELFHLFGKLKYNKRKLTSFRLACMGGLNTNKKLIIKPITI